MSKYKVELPTLEGNNISDYALLTYGEMVEAVRGGSVEAASQLRKVARDTLARQGFNPLQVSTILFNGMQQYDAARQELDALDYKKLSEELHGQ